MERALIICGSAGRGGITESMCQIAADRIRARNYDAVVVFPSEMRIEHCRGCELCSTGPCVIDDDMNRLYRLFAESDLVIMATPLHFSGPSSVIKTVMDRFQTNWYGKGLPHPMATAGMICAGSTHPNYEPTIAIMRAFAITTRMAWLGHLGFGDTDNRGSVGLEEEVIAFIDGILDLRQGRSASQIWPPNSTGGA